MAVHGPLSLEAQLEARVLMMSTNNILSPSSGKPIIVPSQDIILGLYYLSLIKENAKGEGIIFSSVEEVLIALNHEVVDLQANIKLRIPINNENDKKEYKIIDTTPGRAKISSVIPKHASVDYEIVNKPVSYTHLTLPTR